MAQTSNISVEINCLIFIYLFIYIYVNMQNLFVYFDLETKQDLRANKKKHFKSSMRDEK